MIKQINGEHLMDSFKKVASVAFAINDVVTKNSAGYLVKATALTPKSELIGLIQRNVVATDPDYASNSEVLVELFNPEAEYEATVDTGTLVQSMFGKAFDLNDENGINVNKQLQKCFKITKVISTTKAHGKFVTDGETMKLISYQQKVTLAEFTDGTGASGTKALGCVIPAGAVFARSLVTEVTGFIGDTSAVLTIGDGTDVDRYNTGTPSVFADAPAGADVGAPSGTLFHAVDKTPTLTVTSATDFTALSAGELLVTLFWYVAK